MRTQSPLVGLQIQSTGAHRCLYHRGILIHILRSPRASPGFPLHPRSTYTLLDPRSFKNLRIIKHTLSKLTVTFIHFLPTKLQPKAKQEQTKQHRQDAIQRRRSPCRHGLRCCCSLVRTKPHLRKLRSDMIPRTVYVTVPCSTSSSSSSGVASPTVVASTGVKSTPTPTGSPISYATGAASVNAVSGSALGMIIAGGVALVSSNAVTSESSC
jgi:hypothetical protein